MSLENIIEEQTKRIDKLEKDIQLIGYSCFVNEETLLFFIDAVASEGSIELNRYLEYLVDQREKKIDAYAEAFNVEKVTVLGDD